MSLINDMLKDLDSDHTSETQPLPAGLTEKQQDKSPNFRRYLLPVIALTALAYALLVEWNLLGIMPEKKSAPVDIPQPIALNSKWLQQKDAAATDAASAPVVEKKAADHVAVQAPPAAEAVMPGDNQSPAEIAVVAEEPAAIAVGNPPADVLLPTPSNDQANPLVENHRDAVDRLLTEAERALAENRLTTPVGDNAYQLYKSVLVIDADNAAAQSGIETIRQRYLAWLDRAVANQRTGAAQLYWQKAKSVGVDSTALTSYAEVLAKTPAAPVGTVDTALVVLPEASITPAATVTDSEFAQRLRSDGLRREKEALRFLAQSSSAPQTVVVLTDFYVERRAVAEVRRLADMVTNQPVQNYVMAQLYLLDGQDQRALQSLASMEFSGEAEQQRVRLLAGLQQRAGEYAIAMELYAGLVAASPDNVGDWLGLAVSADKSKLTGTALNAYEKVLLLRHPDQRVMQFARQRQQDLSLAAIHHR